MSKPITLESFDRESPDQEDARAALSEEEWLKVFEKGYKDGWDDATRTHEKAQAHVGSELANTLEQISFTLVEARAKAIKDLKPMMRALFESFFQPSLDQLLLDQLLGQIDELSQKTVEGVAEILVSPDNVERLQAMVGDQHHLPVRIAGDVNLGSGQAFLRLADSEQKIDLPATLTAMRQIVDDFFETPDSEKEQAYG